MLFPSNPAAAVLQGEVWGHKQRADKLQARLDTFAHELWQVRGGSGHVLWVLKEGEEAC